MNRSHQKNLLSTFTNRLVYCLGAASILVGLAGCGQSGQDGASPQATATATQPSITGAKILVFSKTAGWRHDSIPAGIAALQKLADEHQFTLVASEDSALFTDADLRQFNAIVFLNTTANVLDENQELAMERYIQAGGGFVGIHAAADTESEGDWFWYRKLVGAVFKNHPNEPSNVQTATVNITDKKHLSTEKMPDSFSMADEWYNYRDMYQFVNVLAKVDESTYVGGEHGHDHPISWYHEFDGGRAFYTGMGHSNEVFANPEFLQHLLGGLTYAVGLNHAGSSAPRLDYTKSRPESNRFIKKTLVENLDEPVKFDFFPNGDALIALRPGKFQLVNKAGVVSDAGQLEGIDYDKFQEWGLVGVAIDPDFAKNQAIYAAFAVKDDAGNIFQRLSRFTWRNNQVDGSTEVQILQYPIENNCCHTGGDLQFGKNGELFFSTGDNTNPHDQDGYAPLDFRPDMRKNDGLRSAGNTKDMRGKVLRIIPKADGGYDIPEGNLFTDPAQGNPEIYVMGARNPYSITYDKQTHTLFYGDIGPDASAESDEKGSRGYDEINRVTAAGNFGWPLVIGQNKPYRYYDYVNKKGGEEVDLNAPINSSPNNTGAKELPPAQPAFIAYPYGISDVFPEMGTGGRSALVADVYRSKDYPESVNRYPSYYDDKLFILDFMRSWVKAVSFDEQGRIRKIEPFAPQINYSLPIDAKFAPDGTLYVLEYGMSWFTGNPDARLARVEYVGAGNRPPIAEITVSKTQSGIPASIQASAEKSVDLDGDKITFQWQLSCVDNSCPEQNLGTDVGATLSLDKAASYKLSLTVTDAHGSTAVASTQLDVGNEPSVIEFSAKQNQTFYWPDTTKIDYAFSINDKEDGAITQSENQNPLIQFEYVKPAAKAEGHQVVDVIAQAKALVDANNCLGCHKIEEKVVGPALRDVAKKYENDPNAISYLVNKLANGGSGVWGEMNMPAFSGLSEADLTALATYVMSLKDDKTTPSLPLSGVVELKSHQQSTAALKANEAYMSTGEAYVFTASYIDKGANGMVPVHTSKQVKFIPHRLDFNGVFIPATATKGVSQESFGNLKMIKLSAENGQGSFSIGSFDLTSVKSIKVGASFFKELTPWAFEIRKNGVDGDVVASGVLTPTEMRTYHRISIDVNETNGFTDLYVVAKPEQKSTADLRLLDITFEK